jgi:hypothetical protein
MSSHRPDRRQFAHPIFYSLWTKLLIPRRKERIRETRTLSVAADFDHLRVAVGACLDFFVWAV